MRATAVILLSVTLLAAGCLSATPPAVQPDAPSSAPLSLVATDAAGDAFEFAPQDTVAEAACSVQCADLPPGAPAPHFDLLGVEVRGQSETDLFLAIQVASLTSTFPELDATAAGHRVASYIACMEVASVAAWGCASLTTVTYGDRLEYGASYSFDNEHCNEWGDCGWSIPATVEFGAPATIIFTVPKVYALWGGGTPTITSLNGLVTWGAFNKVSPAWHTALSINADTNFHRHAGTGEAFWGMPDVLDLVPASLAFTPPPAAAPVSVERVATLERGNRFGHGSVMDHPELDLLAVDLREEAGELVTTFTVESFTEVPVFDFLFIVEIGVQGKEVWEVGYIKEGQHGSYGYAGHCISYECGGDGGDHEAHTMEEQFSEVVPADVQFGSPATITVRTPLALFPSLTAGDVTNMLLAVSMYADAGVWHGTYGDHPRMDWHKMSFIDVVSGGAPHVFTQGNAPMPGHAH